jgi:hypothetical protein
MHCGRRAFTRATSDSTLRASSLAPILAWTRSRCLPRVGRRSYFFEPISNAVKRLDHVELNVACPELLAQSLDVAVDSPVVHIALFAIGYGFKFQSAGESRCCANHLQWWVLDRRLWLRDLGTHEHADSSLLTIRREGLGNIDTCRNSDR